GAGAVVGGRRAVRDRRPPRRRPIADRRRVARCDCGLARRRRRRRRVRGGMARTRRIADRWPSGWSEAVTARTLAAVFVIEAVSAAGLAAVALDMRAHYRVEDLGGVNVRGYRGPVMDAKRPNEIRIMVAGGDLAFGWGVAAKETMAYFLRQQAA